MQGLLILIFFWYKMIKSRKWQNWSLFMFSDIYCFYFSTVKEQAYNQKVKFRYTMRDSQKVQISMSSSWPMEYSTNIWIKIIYSTSYSRLDQQHMSNIMFMLRTVHSRVCMLVGDACNYALESPNRWLGVVCVHVCYLTDDHKDLNYRLIMW